MEESNGGALVSNEFLHEVVEKLFSENNKCLIEENLYVEGICEYLATPPKAVIPNNGENDFPYDNMEITDNLKLTKASLIYFAITENPAEKLSIQGICDFIKSKYPGILNSIQEKYKCESPNEKLEKLIKSVVYVDRRFRVAVKPGDSPVRSPSKFGEYEIHPEYSQHLYIDPHDGSLMDRRFWKNIKGAASFS